MRAPATMPQSPQWRRRENAPRRDPGFPWPAVAARRGTHTPPSTPGTTSQTICPRDRKSTRLNSSHGYISYAVFCLKKKNSRYKVVKWLVSVVRETQCCDDVVATS